MTYNHHVSEFHAINGTKSQPESGPSWDHVGTKSGPSRDQVISKPSTQFHKITFSQNGIKSVTIQVGEQVPTTNHRGHRDIEDENANMQIHHKPCDELPTQQMIDTIRYPVGSELNTCFNPQSGHIIGYNRG